MSARVAAAQQAAFDVHDAAAYVGLSVDVVRRAMNAGNLPAFFPTSKPMFKRDDLDRWIDSWPTEKPGKSASWKPVRAS